MAIEESFSGARAVYLPICRAAGAWRYANRGWGVAFFFDREGTPGEALMIAVGRPVVPGESQFVSVPRPGSDDEAREQAAGVGAFLDAAKLATELGVYRAPRG